MIFIVLGVASAAIRENMTILALGDSTTAGTPAFRSPLEDPPYGSGDEKSQYAYWMMQKHPGWKVLNRGIAGQRSDEILSRFQQDISALRFQMVIVLAGVNDIYQGYSSEHVKSNLQQIYDLASQKNVRVLACTILPYDGASFAAQQKMREVNDWIQSYSSSHGFLFCDTFKLLNDPARPGNLINSPDGLHPDIQGYRKMGETITSILENQV